MEPISISEDLRKVVDLRTKELTPPKDPSDLMRLAIASLVDGIILTSIAKQGGCDVSIMTEISQVIAKLVKKTKRPTKRKIPAAVRMVVWSTHFPNEYVGKCMCCGVEPITRSNFQCGHVVSEAKGGDEKIDNLRPICSTCNTSMGTTSMDEFMKKHGINEKTHKAEPEQIIEFFDLRRYVTEKKLTMTTLKPIAKSLKIKYSKLKRDELINEMDRVLSNMSVAEIVELIPDARMDKKRDIDSTCQEMIDTFSGMVVSEKREWDGIPKGIVYRNEVEFHKLTTMAHMVDLTGIMVYTPSYEKKKKYYSDLYRELYYENREELHKNMQELGITTPTEYMWLMARREWDAEKGLAKK